MTIRLFRSILVYEKFLIYVLTHNYKYLLFSDDYQKQVLKILERRKKWIFKCVL